MLCSQNCTDVHHLFTRASKNHCYAGLNWRKLAPVPILALVTEYCELPDEQVVVLFQILAAEINFGYKFQTVKYALLFLLHVSCSPACSLKSCSCIASSVASGCLMPSGNYELCAPILLWVTSL